MNIITLESKQYQLIQGTQSDGRCFFASIFYSLYNIIPLDEELNSWIQQYIIEPILDKSITNCPLFSEWALNYVTKQFPTLVSDEFSKNTLTRLLSVFTRINILINSIKKFSSEPADNIKESPKVKELFSSIIETLTDIYSTYSDLLDITTITDDEITFSNFLQNII